MHMPHAHATCTCHMHMPHAHATCTCHMHMPHAHATCTCHMHMPHAHATCTCHMHMPHAHATCTCHMHMPHAHATCTCWRAPRAHCLCTLPMHTAYAHCVHTGGALSARAPRAAAAYSCRCTRPCWCSSSRGSGEGRRAPVPKTACVRRASCDGSRRCCVRRAGSNPSPSMTAPHTRGRASSQP